MSTRSVIGKWVDKDQGKIDGRYHHSDGYPEGLGATLWRFLKNNFGDDTERLLNYVLSERSGWSSMVDSDPRIPPSWTETIHHWEIQTTPEDYGRMLALIHLINTGDMKPFNPLPEFIIRSFTFDQVVIKTYEDQELQETITLKEDDTSFKQWVDLIYNTPRCYNKRHTDYTGDWQDDWIFRDISKCNHDYTYMIDVDERVLHVYYNWQGTYARVSFDVPEPNWDDLPWEPQTAQTGYTGERFLAHLTIQSEQSQASEGLTDPSTSNQ